MSDNQELRKYSLFASTQPQKSSKKNVTEHKEVVAQSGPQANSLLTVIRAVSLHLGSTESHLDQIDSWLDTISTSLSTQSTLGDLFKRPALGETRLTESESKILSAEDHLFRKGNELTALKKNIKLLQAKLDDLENLRSERT